MKKLIFTLMMMAGLALVAGTAMGQSTQSSPFEGSSYTYQVNGLTEGDSYDFYVTLSSYTGSDPTNNTVAEGTGYTFGTINTETGIVQTGETTALVDITWGTTAFDDGPFNLWIEIEDSESSCFNYRFVTITPAENTLAFSITAAGIGDGSTAYDFSSSTISGTEGCAVLDGTQDWDDTDGSSSDGSTWVYFRINRTDGTSGEPWTFDFSATNAGGTTSIDGYYGGSTISSMSDISSSLDDISAGTGDVYYVRVQVALASDLQLITGSLDDAKETDTGLANTATEPDTDTFTIEETPTVTGFEGF